MDNFGGDFGKLEQAVMEMMEIREDMTLDKFIMRTRPLLIVRI